MDKPVTVIVSDLHVGGGAADPGDDHVYDHQQFVMLLEKMASEEAGRQGKVELIINGDFLEFGQVLPQAYALGSAYYWCSENESLQKLEAIISGHPEIFKALEKFQEPGNLVTIAAGNHDVDLYWPGVQNRIRSVAGQVSFEVGHETYSRYNGRLLIGHGHMYDPANRFNHWDKPILPEPSGDDRLEMCPGTLFMTKFVNWLENLYPFADNIKPVTALGRVLWKESKLGLLSVAWVLSEFMARHPSAALGTSEDTSIDIADIIHQTFNVDDSFRMKFVALYNEVYDQSATAEVVGQAISTDEGLWEFLKDMIGKIHPERWLPVFDMGLPETLSIEGEEAETLAIIHSGMKNEKEFLRETARTFFLDGAEVVVFGHTHQPDKLEENGKRYFNPGSWTRYLQMEKLKNVTLNDLKDEEDFPYELNFIRIEQSADNTLAADLYPFDKQDGNRFKA